MPRSYRSDARADRARDTRRRVVAAATHRFARLGYAATTVRAVAAEAGVSVPTVEAAFGTKAELLKAAIDVAIAGDDEQVAVLARPWAERAAAAPTGAEVLAIAAEVLAPAQHRSSGLVLAVFEGAVADPALGPLAEQMVAQRRATAAWLVDTVARTTALRDDREQAVDTLWALMDPALYDRLVRRLGWSTERYQGWIASSAQRLLLTD